MTPTTQQQPFKRMAIELNAESLDALMPVVRKYDQSPAHIIKHLIGLLKTKDVELMKGL